MSSRIMLAAGAIFAVATAVPMAKRDVVWVTETDVDVVTVPVTTIVYVDPTGNHYGHHNRPTQSTVTSYVLSTSTTTSVVSAISTPEDSSSSVAPITSTSISVAPTSTSTYIAPTTTSTYVAPTSTSTYVAPTTTAAPTTTSVVASSTTSTAASASATSGSTVYEGDITYYDVGLGSCGWTNSDDEAVVAIAHVLMNNPANPNNNPWCGQYITISYAGATHQAKVVDTCGGCDGQSIDLSPTLFSAVAPSGDGRVHDVEWWFT